MRSKPDFSTPKKFIRSGFDRIASGLSLPWLVSGRLYSAFEAAHITGDPRKEKAAIAGALKGETWRWPWLEACAADFDKLGVWPSIWTSYGVDSPLNWQAIPTAVRVEFLWLTLISAVCSDRAADQLTDALKTVPIWKARLVLGRPACPAERHIAARYHSQIANGNFRQLPPFFPTDTGYVRLQRSADD